MLALAIDWARIRLRESLEKVVAIDAERQQTIQTFDAVRSHYESVKAANRPQIDDLQKALRAVERAQSVSRQRAAEAREESDDRFSMNGYDYQVVGAQHQLDHGNQEVRRLKQEIDDAERQFNTANKARHAAEQAYAAARAEADTDQAELDWLLSEQSDESRDTNREANKPRGPRHRA